jgi:hypothetical protein
MRWRIDVPETAFRCRRENVSRMRPKKLSSNDHRGLHGSLGLSVPDVEKLERAI